VDGSEWELKFRADRSQHKLVILCTIVMIIFGISSTVAAFFNLDGSFPRPLEAAVIFSLFWGAWTLLGIYGLVFFKKYQLCMNSKSLHQVGVFKEQLISFDSIKELRWRNVPDGTVRILASDGNATIWLQNFTATDRQKTIDFLRDNIPHSLQTGWNDFRLIKPVKPPNEVESSKWWYRAWIVVFVVCSVAFVFGDRVGIGRERFWGVALSVAGAIYLFVQERKFCKRISEQISKVAE
jgi:hypothetical protein